MLLEKRMIRLHAERKSKITVSQIFSKELTQRRNEALKKRKEILQKPSGLNIYLIFPAYQMAKKKNSGDKYKQIEILNNSLSVCSVGILQTSTYFTF